jgi:hypothetical protein
MEDRTATSQATEWNSQGQSRRGRPLSTWNDGIRDNKQSRKLKDQECFYREPRRGGGEIGLLDEENYVVTQKSI